jgi:hypothetical protein
LIWLLSVPLPPELPVQLKQIDRFPQQREFEVIGVLDLMCWETKVKVALTPAAAMDEVPVHVDRGEVLDAHRRIQQQLDREGRLDQLGFTIAVAAALEHLLDE